jgi:hypothetical protein
MKGKLFQTYVIWMVGDGKIMSVRNVEVFHGLREVSIDFATLIQISSTSAINVRLSRIAHNPICVYNHAVTNSHMWNTMLLPT